MNNTTPMTNTELLAIEYELIALHLFMADLEAAYNSLALTVLSELSA